MVGRAIAIVGQPGGECSGLVLADDRDVIAAHVPAREDLASGAIAGQAIEGYQPRPNEDTEINTNVIGLNFFQTIGMPRTQSDRAHA